MNYVRSPSTHRVGAAAARVFVHLAKDRRAGSSTPGQHRRARARLRWAALALNSRRMLDAMPRTRMTNVSAAQWSPNGGAMGQSDLTQAGAYAFGANVFSPAIQRQRLRQGGLQAPAGDAGQRAAPRPRARRRHRDRDEGLGDGARLHALHALVPAAHRLDRGEARLVLQPDRRRPRAGRVLRQGADPGRAGRVVVPDRRHPRHVRGARLHGVGPVVAGVHPREPERRAALHPDGVRVVDGRGAGPQDPAAALDGRALALRACARCGCSATTTPRACSRRSGPSRSTS